MATLNYFKHEIEKYKKNHQKSFYPQHVSIVCEILDENRNTKYIKIDKTNTVRVLTEFDINNENKVISVKPKKKITIKSLLNLTLERIEIM